MTAAPHAHQPEQAPPAHPEGVTTVTAGRIGRQVLATRAVLTRHMPDGLVPVTTRADDEVVELLERGRVLILSGAGLSTESGVPDYRGPQGSLRRHTPMTYEEFVSDPAARRRYWGRSHIGWPVMAAAAPNRGHRAVAMLQRAGLIEGIVTQNVDGLHQRGGGRDVVELHGALSRVSCLACGELSDRRELEVRLEAANPWFEATVTRIREREARTGGVNPDGDVDLPDALVDGFAVVDCLDCGGGPLKPDVVFFGETVPRQRVRRCEELVDACRTMVVLGSSLSVMSGLRFVRRAARAGVPVVVVNRGPTRGDPEAIVRVDAPLGDVLADLTRRLGLTSVY